MWNGIDLLRSISIPGVIISIVFIEILVCTDEVNRFADE